jgi:hypothetical protein
MPEQAGELYCAHPNHLILNRKFLRDGKASCAVGDKQREAVKPEFDRSISIDFLGAKITSEGLGPEWPTMSERSPYMFRRLFLSPVTIESFSPDPQYRVRRRNESTNREGGGGASEIARPIAQGYLLHVRSENCKVSGFRVAAEVFRAQSDSQIWLGCIAHH